MVRQFKPGYGVAPYEVSELHDERYTAAPPDVLENAVNAAKNVLSTYMPAIYSI